MSCVQLMATSLHKVLHVRTREREIWVLITERGVMLAWLVFRGLTVTCVAPHSKCLCPFSSLALSLAVHLAYIGVESTMTHILSRTVFQLRWEAHFSANRAHSFHKPGLSAFVLTLIVKYGLDDGDGMVCRHKCFISVVSGCRTNRKLKWGFLLGSSTCSESAPCPCRFLSALLLEGCSWVLPIGPPRRRWLHPACCHESDSSLPSRFLHSSSHFLIYLLLHPCTCPFMCSAHGWLWSVSLCEHQWSRMSSTETLPSMGSQYLGERSTYNLVHLMMHGRPTMHRLQMEHVSRVEWRQPSGTMEKSSVGNRKHPWRHVVRDNIVDWRIISS